jgi:hypothetical protein
MNDQASNSPGSGPGPSKVQPAGPPPIIPGRPAPPPPGPATADQTPIRGVSGALEALLRQPERVMFQLGRPDPAGLIRTLVGIAIVCSLVYGVVVGTFSGGAQLWGAPVKIAGGVLISALICLPSLYVFACLSGSQARVVEVSGLVAGLLALMSVLLLGFAPVAWVFSQSTRSVAIMGALHIAFWLVAAGFGLRFLQAGFRHLNSRSDGGFRLWVVVFLLVACQIDHGPAAHCRHGGPIPASGE